MRRMELMSAAGLAAASYKGRSHLPPVRKTIKEGHVEAYLLTDNTLVITGSNQLVDYTRSNLVLGDVKIAWHAEGKAIGNAIWHKGFALHAATICNALGSVKPSFVVGHSLGAAAAQIIGCIYGVPAIGFASPMPRRGKGTLKNEKYVLNIVRNDDTVCRMPPKQFGFRRVGKVKVMVPPRDNPGEDHSMPNYISLLGAAVQQGAIAPSWPR